MPTMHDETRLTKKVSAPTIADRIVARMRNGGVTPPPAATAKPAKAKSLSAQIIERIRNGGKS